MLKGKRIVLRPIEKTDVPDLLVWFNDPEVSQYLSLYLPMTRVGEEKWIEEVGTIRSMTDIVFMIDVIEDKVVKSIGNCGLHKINWKDRNVEFGIAIGDKDYWGKGYGMEAAKLIIGYAFGQLNMHRISSGAYGFNTRSIKMQLKLGFKKEGVDREAIFKNGKYHNIIFFGLLRKEWQMKKK